MRKYEPDEVAWRYSYNPFNERESKKMVKSPAGDNGSQTYPLMYYLLDEKNRQHINYIGMQSSNDVLMAVDDSTGLPIYKNNKYKDYFWPTCIWHYPPDPPPSKREQVLIYPAQLNVFGGSSSPLISYKYDKATTSWIKHYNIYDHLGTVVQTYKDLGMNVEPTSMQSAMPFGESRWNNDNLATKEKNLLGWIGKERDNESNLGDHGVRKYEAETGRFTSIDPLWASYYGWSPYQYSMNSPIYSLDINGKAQYILNGGTILDDNISDGLLFASNTLAFNSSIIESFDGGPGIDFSNLRQSSYLLPRKEIMREILSNHRSEEYGEAGGVGGFNSYHFGGRNGIQNAKASDEVQNAFNMAKQAGDLLNINYYVHDHPIKNSFGVMTRNIMPTNSSDRDALSGLFSQGAKNIRFGILFNLDKVNIFGTENGLDIIFDRQIIEDYAW